MTSKELNEILNKTRRTKDISLTPEQVEEIVKKLEVLEILKEFLSDADTGTGWIEININPDHDILDSEEHKKKQLLIKEWLENDKH